MNESRPGDVTHPALVELRRAQEVADLHFATLNAVVRYLATLRCIRNDFVVGEIFHQEPHDRDGFNVYLAAVSVQEGIGATVFDAEELLDVIQVPGEIEMEAGSHFKPVFELHPNYKLQLHSKVDDLMSRLFRRLHHSIAASI